MSEVLEFRALGLRPGLIKDAILQKCREARFQDDYSQEMAEALQRVCDEYSLTAPILRLAIDGPENWQHEAVESVVRAAPHTVRDQLVVGAVGALVLLYCYLKPPPREAGQLVRLGPTEAGRKMRGVGGVPKVELRSPRPNQREPV